MGVQHTPLGEKVDVVVLATTPGFRSKAAEAEEVAGAAADAARFKGAVLARYQESGAPLLSGYLIGEKYLHGKAAALTPFRAR